MKAHLVALLVLSGALAGPLNAAPTQRALLVGINTYQPTGTVAQRLNACPFEFVRTIRLLL